jgi:hypothetical protein
MFDRYTLSFTTLSNEVFAALSTAERFARTWCCRRIRFKSEGACGSACSAYCVCLDVTLDNFAVFGIDGDSAGAENQAVYHNCLIVDSWK